MQNEQSIWARWPERLSPSSNFPASSGTDSVIRLLTLLYSASRSQKIAIGIIAALWGCLWRLLLSDALDERFIYITFFPAVTLAALFGGVIAGMTATILSGLAAHIWFAPLIDFNIQNALQNLSAIRKGVVVLADFGDFVAVTTFLMSGGLISFVVAMLHQTLIRAADADTRRADAESLRLAISAGAIGTWDLDLAKNVAKGNANIKEIFGFAPDAQISADDATRLILDEDLPTMQAAFRSALGPAGDGVYSSEYRIRRANDACIRWIRAQAQTFVKNGRAVRMIGVCQDVTDEKESAKALLERARLAEQLASVASAAPGAIFSCHLDTDGSTSFPYASPNMDDLAGLSSCDLMKDGQPLWSRVHAKDLRGKSASMCESARTLTLWRTIFRYHHPRKGLVWLEWQGMPVRNAFGDITWHGYALDVTERIGAEVALRASEARLRAVFDGANEGIITTDEAGVIQSINACGIAMFGYESQQVIGKSVSLLLPERQRHGCERHIRNNSWLRKAKSLGKTLGIAREFEGQRSDGSLFPVEVALSEACYDQTRLLIGFVRDLSERRKIEVRIKHLREERLNAMGGMAASLAHEINQPLSAAGTYLRTAKALLDMPKDERPASAEETLELAAAQIKRAGQIVTHLREFVDRGEPDKTNENIHALIREALEFVTIDEKDYAVGVSLDLSAERDEVLVDRVQIVQVLVNLIRNAKEAMVTSPRRELTIATSLLNDRMIRIDVADTGVGLPAKVERRLFEAFVTTKSSGMGIGLPISRLIIEEHWGKIWAQSNPIGGAIFSFTLPAERGA